MTNEEMYAKNKADREKRQRAQHNRAMVRRSASRVASAGGSMMETFFGSFDKVLAIFLALILLFSMQNMMIETDDGLVAITPVMTALSLGGGVNYADVDAVSGIGYETGADGAIGGRYFSLDRLSREISFVSSFGNGTNPFLRGGTGIIAFGTYLFTLVTSEDSIGEWITDYMKDTGDPIPIFKLNAWSNFIEDPSWDNLKRFMGEFWHSLWEWEGIV